MNKILRFIGFALLSCALFPVHAEQPTASDSIKIGFIMPLTGSAAPWGKHMLNALTLAQESLPEQARARISVTVEDDQLKATQAVSAFNRLSDSAAVSVAVVFGGQSVAATAPLAEKKQLPSFMITANSELVKGRRYSFRHWLGAQEQADVLIPEIRRQKLKRIAVVATTQEATLDFIARCKSSLANSSVHIVFDESFPPSETDFRTAIQKIAATRPDGILFGLLPPHISIFARQLKEQHLPLQIFGASNTGTSTEVEAAQGALEGALYSSPSLTQDFISRYEKKFNSFPELSAGNIYDIVMMIADGAQKGARTRADFTEHIRGLQSFNGVLGHYGLLPDNSFRLRAELWAIRDGKFVPAS